VRAPKAFGAAAFERQGQPNAPYHHSEMPSLNIHALSRPWASAASPIKVPEGRFESSPGQARPV